jgi:hypothetical protein
MSRSIWRSVTPHYKTHFYSCKHRICSIVINEFQGDAQQQIQNMNDIMFLRRIGPSPRDNEARCSGCSGCPDIWELDNGDFAVIGLDVTDAVMSKLPPTAGCSRDERIVRLPRSLLVNAKRYIPEPL